MSGSPGNPHPGDIFDIKRIRRLVELMNEHELAELDLRQGDQRIRLRKGPEGVVAVGSPTVIPPSPAAPERSAAVSPGGAPAADAGLLIVKSPMVGTFYTASSPDNPPFVKVGDHVHPQSTVCLIEAMKVFNEIPAEVSGQIVAVLVQNGEPVEFGQPLFKVDPKK